jgi:hypothetical protein
MSKHTPGPWGFDPDNWGQSFKAGWGILALDEDGCALRPAYIHVERNGYDHHEEAEANARLIAAAPELLEALKAKLAARVHNERVKADEMARAAIAKATGEKP